MVKAIPNLAIKTANFYKLKAILLLFTPYSGKGTKIDH